MLRQLSLVALLGVGVGCSGVNLGDIDESVDGREEMPGPGIFADEQGESILKWSSSGQAPAASGQSSDVSLSPEQNEFEQFKLWNELRSKGADSSEYLEFQQWLEYQQFKAGQ